MRLITFFAAKDEEAIYSQQKQDQELMVTQIMNCLLPNSDLNWRKQGKPLDHSRMTKIKPLYYTVKVTNGFKRLDLIDRVSKKLWM